MAKSRHRTFEIFDDLDEASDALASKSAPEHPYSLDPELWRFRQLDVTIRPSGVVHVTFKQEAESQSEESKSDSTNVFRKDLADLSGWLTNGSRVLVDFAGVSEFAAETISELGEFHKKLKNKGSRIVLCHLGPAVRDSFFPHLRTNASS